MPSKYASVEDLPLPKDARVKLVEVPEYKVVGVQGWRGDSTRWRCQSTRWVCRSREGQH